MEIQKLYQSEHVNPLGGCLWSFLPLPILIALYGIIRRPVLNFMLINMARPEALEKVEALKAAQQAASATQKKSNSSTTTTTTTSNTAANTTTSTTTTDSSDDTIDTSQGKYLGRFKLTAYCNCPICCGKWSGGGTASGTTPTPGRTIAMAGVPFGTKLSINGQIYTVEDRGTAYGHVDIFMGSHSQALSFGMKYADVYQVN